MTRDEIKRAFDICCDTHGCTGCPLLALEQQNGCDCRHNLFVSAIDLATEYEREIAQLKDENERFENNMKNILEIEKKQAVKEFADEIKDYINNKVEDEYGDMSDSVNYITIDIDEFETFIDNLLEEQNGKDKD